MSAAGETKQQPSEGFVSDDDKVILTPAGDDSFSDFFPFEELINNTDDSPIEETIVIAEEEKKDAAINVAQELVDLSRSRLRNLPDMQHVLNWIMGRNIVIDGNIQLVERPFRISRQIKAARTNIDQEMEQIFRRPKLIDDDFLDIGDVQDICPACTTPYCTALDSLPFKGSLRLSYNDPETHTWSIGDKYILTESIDEEGPERPQVTLVRATQLFKRCKVPVPNVLAGWKENGRVITISEKAEGERLYDIWWDLDQDEREKIAKEVARYIGRWRACVADSISSLSGGPVWGHDQLFGTRHEGFGPFENDEQLWDVIQARLRERNVHETVIQTLKDYMPESAPCLLTHGDVSSYNVLIRDGEVSAILGLDRAARLPAWAEYVAAHFCCCKEDEQWKAMLTRHMTRYPRTRDWWALWACVASGASNGSGKRVAKLVARCRRWQKSPRKKRAYDLDADDGEWPRDDEDEDGDDPHDFRRSSTIIAELMPGLDLRHNTWEDNGRGGGGAAEKGKRRRQELAGHEAMSPATQQKKKLMKPRRYTELLEDSDWQEPVGSQSGDSDIIVPLNEFALSEIERRMEAERARVRESEAAGGTPAAPRRISIERWLAESVRGRRAIRPLLINTAGIRKGEAPLVSPTKSPPWRERQRSFERPQTNTNTTSKGLRPLSLTQQSGGLTEAAKKNLREIGERQERLEENDESDSRERALRVLEGEGGDGDAGGDDAEVAAGAGTVDPVDKMPEDAQQARHSSPAQQQGKRASIFRERTRPGSLYLAVATAGAEGRTRRYRRSLSEERTGEVAEEQDEEEQGQTQTQTQTQAQAQAQAQG